MKQNYKKLSFENLQSLLKKGDEKAFSEVYNRLCKPLYTYAYRIYNDSKICEDIVQELFISLWEKSQCSEILNLEAYLFQSIKYKISSHIRSLKFTSTHIEVLQNIPQSEAFERKIEYQEFEDWVHLKIDKLTPSCRKVFLLSRFEQMSNNEIATKLNLSIRTVEKHISNALKELKNSITPIHISLLCYLYVFLM